MTSEPPFIKGLDLNRGFYREIVKPILDRSFPGLSYSASLIGYGSDVMGMDTERSTDHNWGPRMQIFVDGAAEGAAEGCIIPRIDGCLREELSLEYRGYPVNFSDAAYDKTRSMEKSRKKPVNHLIEISGFEDYLKARYSMEKTRGFSPRDWLAFKDQALIEITSGEVFHDGLEKLEAVRRELAFYPPDIRKLRMAILWHYISNKEAFVGRCAALDDFIGLKLNSGRIVNYLIKILFYLEKKYIPYSKWFGSAFKKLEAYDEIAPLVKEILSENVPAQIEEKLCLLYTFVVGRHNATEGLPRLHNAVRNYFGRPYRVIFAETIITELMNSIADEEIKKSDLRRFALDIIVDE